MVKGERGRDGVGGGVVFGCVNRESLTMVTRCLRPDRLYGVSLCVHAETYSFVLETWSLSLWIVTVAFT